MANRPLNMQKIRQILLFLERGFSQRSIERETGINRRTIAGYLQRFADSGFSIAELLFFSDVELEAYLNAGKAEQVEKDPRRIHLESQFSYLFSELRRVGVTRQLLWQEYINEYPDGFGYSRFCEVLQEHIRKQGAAAMKQSPPYRYTKSRMSMNYWDLWYRPNSNTVK